MYAVGDVAGDWQLAHTAFREGESPPGVFVDPDGQGRGLRLPLSEGVLDAQAAVVDRVAEIFGEHDVAAK